jgi:hypothetical protein
MSFHNSFKNEAGAVSASSFGLLGLLQFLFPLFFLVSIIFSLFWFVLFADATSKAHNFCFVIRVQIRLDFFIPQVACLFKCMFGISWCHAVRPKLQSPRFLSNWFDARPTSISASLVSNGSTCLCIAKDEGSFSILTASCLLFERPMGNERFVHLPQRIKRRPSNQSVIHSMRALQSTGDPFHAHAAKSAFIAHFSYDSASAAPIFSTSSKHR